MHPERLIRFNFLTEQRKASFIQRLERLAQLPATLVNRIPEMPRTIIGGALIVGGFLGSSTAVGLFIATGDNGWAVTSAGSALAMLGGGYLLRPVEPASLRS